MSSAPGHGHRVHVAGGGVVQVAPLNMFDEKNTGSNLPAQIELYATPGSEYGFLFIAKVGMHACAHALEARCLAARPHPAAAHPAALIQQQQLMAQSPGQATMSVLGRVLHAAGGQKE